VIRRVALAMAVLLVAPVQGALQGSAEPPAQEPATAPIKGADLDLLRIVRRIGQRVEQLRQQKFVRPPIAVRAPDQMREVTAEIRMLNAVKRERLEARGRAWVDLGLGEASSPRSLYLAICGDLAGILFDPEGNRLLVAPDRLTDNDFGSKEGEDDAPATVLMMTGVRVDEPVVSHLLIHVLQRERGGGDWVADTTDSLLARAAWAEGEANVVAIRYLFGGMGLADDVLEESLDPADVLEGALLPPVLGDLAPPVDGMVRFVYDEGFAAASRAYREGGWKAVSAASERRATTRDVMHPGREPFAPPTITAEPPRQAEGLALADEDTLGERGIVEMVSSLTGKDDLALQAGDGWAGDRVYRWESSDPAKPGGVTLWITRWTTDDEAADFDYALTRILEARFPGRPPVTLESGERVLQTQDRILRSSRSGREVRVQVATRDRDALPSGALTDAP